MAIDKQKRDSLKYLAVGAGALAAPGFVAAACNHRVQQAEALNTTLRGTGLVVSFVGTAKIGSARNVIITNTSNSTVTLSHVYPGIVSTPEGSYDLNSLLVNGRREFAANQAVTLTIEAINTKTAKLKVPVESQADAWLSVRTHNSRVNGGRDVTTVRHMIS